LRSEETSQDKLEGRSLRFLEMIPRGNGDTKLVGVAPVETTKRPYGPETVTGIYHLIPSGMS
jgi:hypothetical protein